jgi:hypothetical protein
VITQLGYRRTTTAALAERYGVIQGGGNGAHNPDFVRDALITALAYAEDASPRLP